MEDDLPKKIGHVVRRPGRTLEDPNIEIPVAEDLVSEPGIPQRKEDIAFYSRTEPLETQDITKSADRKWVWSVFSDDILKNRQEHRDLSKPLMDAAAVSGDIEPTAEPVGRDLTDEIRTKAREFTFGEVGFTAFDRRYAFVAKKRWIKFEHAICLAFEQDYAPSQTLPSVESEIAHFGSYETAAVRALDLADYIRSLGYRAQVHHPTDNSAAYIPMFVAAGLGQLGANGQLLSPHFGSRARLLIISTDAPVTYDKPEDYGIQEYCQKCLICVDRCPGRAISKDKIWYRGVLKNKIVYDQCRPIVVRYEGCGVCMKVCPVQRYGMKPVMEHYIETGEVLGKGTDNLEGYTMPGQDYVGPGKMPKFDRDTFDFPHGTREDWLYTQFKEKLSKDGVPSEPELVEFATEVKGILNEGPNTRVDE
jgi:ferredoxin